MKYSIIKSTSRGGADHGWLQAKHSFSFAQFYNEKMIHFGQLRVLNDDIIAPGMGFGTHPHDNMEIVTIPLSGAISHRDSTGGEGTIPAGDVQVMSAGSGVTHSEFNASKTEFLNLFQIWIFPNKKNVEPRYDQKSFDVKSLPNQFHLLVSPDARENSLMIHQDAFIKRGVFDAGSVISLALENTSNGIYMMVIDGEISINDEELRKRDAISLTDIHSVEILIGKAADILVIEVPL
jgi:redox-sensitive bicupin YhaK (pirin superfamily)